MSMYDFSKAQQTIQHSNSTDNKAKYQLVYPGEGKLYFRPMFNPKSEQFYRLIKRHKIQGKNYQCKTTYGGKKDDCPICKMLSNIENAGIQVPKEYNAKVRCIMFAQFIGADYEVAKGQLNKGDIFLLMVPYTIFKQFNGWLSDYFAEGAEGAREHFVASPEATICVIEKGKDANDWQFRENNKMQFQSAETADDWRNILDSLDDLYEQMGFHTEFKAEDIQPLNAVAEALNSAYFAHDNSALDGLSNRGQDEAPRAQDEARPMTAPAQQPVAQPQAPVQQQFNYAQTSTPVAPRPPVATQPTPNVNANLPSCYGSFAAEGSGDISKEKRCKFCPHKVQCKDVTPVEEQPEGDLPF